MTESTTPPAAPEPAPTVSWAAPPPPPMAPAGRSGRFTWRDFFAFRYMITPVLIRVIYAIGAILITLVAIFLVPASVSTNNVGAALAAVVLAFLFGNLYFRVIMELFMVFFGMHESLRAIERQGRG